MLQYHILHDSIYARTHQRYTIYNTKKIKKLRIQYKNYPFISKLIYEKKAYLEDELE